MKNKKNITLEEIVKLTNLAENFSISELVDNSLINNKKKTLTILNENNFSAEDSVLILRIFLSKLKRLLKIQSLIKTSDSVDGAISSFKPPIFWKEKDLVKQQIKIWSLINIKKLISQISTIEQLVKQTPLQSKNILSDFLLKISAKTNSRI